MMHGREKSDLAIVAMKHGEQSGAIRRGVGGAKGGDQGECEPAKAPSGRRAGQTCHRRWSAYGKHLPSRTQGGSRMRESRTYGSVRGARDETHVPTATPARVHHAARRRGSRVAARGARAAGQGADHRLPGREYGSGHEPMDCCFCAATPRTRLDRGSYRRDRVPLGGRTR